MSLLEKEGFIWFDGEFIPWADAKVHVLTHTLHYGAGVFEGVRAYETPRGPAIFRLKAHTNRLFRSAHILNIDIPYSKEVLSEAQKEAIVKNKLNSAYIRPVIFYGAEHLGVQTTNLPVHVAIAVWEWGSYFKMDDPNLGIKAHTSTYTRNYVSSVLCKAKANGNYINSILALQEAKARGCEEALMLDTQGFVSEGSSANVFIVRDDVIYTPCTATILEGITRDTVIILAKKLGITVIEKNLTRDDTYTADEMFFTGTAAEITPVSEMDGRKIGDGFRGKITKTLQDLYSEVVLGKNDDYIDWVTYL